MTTKLDASTARSLQYFHEERGDMTRSVEWEALKPQIRERFPEVIDAMKCLESARRTLDAVVKNMVDSLERESDE